MSDCLTFPVMAGMDKPGRQEITFDKIGDRAVCMVCKETYERTTPEWQRKMLGESQNTFGGKVFSIPICDFWSTREKMWQHCCLHYLIEEGLTNHKTVV